MKRWLAGIAVAFVCTSCSVTSLQRGESRALNARLLWATEGFEFESETNGTVRIRLQKSNPDAEAMKAVAEGAAAGTVKGLKPIP